MPRKPPSGPAMDAGELRRRAEMRLSERRKAAAAPEPDLPRLVQELEIHQFELEIQNEELQQARTDLESLLTRYTDLYDFAPVGYFALRRDGTILQVNLAGARLLEAERTHLVGRRFADFIAADSRPGLTAFLSAACDAPSTRTSEASLLTAAQRKVHVHVEAVASPDGQGCRAALVDTTARVHAESALEASEARYRRLFESSKDGILLLDAASGLVAAVNPTLCAWLGHSADFFRGRALWDIPQFRWIAASRSELREAQARGALHIDRVAVQADDGRRFDVELVTHTYRVADGHILQVSARDIGERLRAERAVRDKEEQQERVRALEAIGRLAGGLAHELNNKLGVVIGGIELLRSRLPQEGSGPQRLDQMEQAARHSAALTRQLLAFARKQILQPKLLTLAPLLSDSLRELSPSLGAHMHVVEKLNAVGHVRVDPAQIQGVITILIANARDAMPEGGTLTVETRDVELAEAMARGGEVIPPGSYVLLAVSDTGPGLAPALRDQVFEPFASAGPDGLGASLSLAAVYGTVKQSAGHVFVESEPGRGATFHVYLRRADEPAAEAPASGAAPPHGIHTVMVVDDEAAILELISELFREEGYDVLAARDGAEAVGLAGARPIDLLITDVIVPKLRGPVVAQRVRARWPQMRVLYMSGHPREELSGQLASADGLIQKPFAMSELLRRVKDLEG